MTGFARVRKTIPEGEIVLSAKSVNHRALDLHFHLPPELDPFRRELDLLDRSYSRYLGLSQSWRMSMPGFAALPRTAAWRRTRAWVAPPPLPPRRPAPQPA